MTTTVNLLTTQAHYEALHQAADGRKATVRVNREVLLHLLIDHSTMYAALKATFGVKVTEPQARPPKRQRVRARG